MKNQHLSTLEEREALIRTYNQLTSLSCHSARRACPELQNPHFQKAKENLIPGEKVPHLKEGKG